MALSKNSQTLESMWTFLSSLSPDSTPESLSQITQFVAPTHSIHLNGMTQPPSTSHATLLSTIQHLITYWKLAERKIVTHVEGADGTVVNAMENKLLILGDAVDGVGECEVVKFDEDGRIREYALYVDPSAMREVFVRKAAETKY